MVFDGDGRERQEGNAFIGTLFAAVVLGALVYTTSMVASTELKGSRKALERVRAYSLAESGVEMAIERIRYAVARTRIYDPFLGIRALLGTGNPPYKPFDFQAVLDGGRKVGNITVTMTGIDRAGGMDITILSTGYPARGSGSRRTSNLLPLTIQTTVRLELMPSRVFDYGYFRNDWAWFYGDLFRVNGNLGSNGPFRGRASVGTVTGQAVYESLSWLGNAAVLSGYQDSNQNGVADLQDGGIFTAMDLSGAGNIQGGAGRHSNQSPISVPNLSNLGPYEAQALSDGGQIGVLNGITVVSVYGDDVGEKQNLYLNGTPANPITISGTVVVRGSLILSGFVSGQGAIYAGGNIYVPKNLVYQNPPGSSRPVDNSKLGIETWLSQNKSKDFLGLFARENIVVGDFTNAGWRTTTADVYVNTISSSGLGEDAGEDFISFTSSGMDGISNTADDDVLEADGSTTMEIFSIADLVNGLIPPGNMPGDPVPGTGEDVDGDGVIDQRFDLTDLDLPAPLDEANWGGIPGGQSWLYTDIASVAVQIVEGVLFTNHALAWSSDGVTPMTINGGILSRNEVLAAPEGGFTINYDCRLLGARSLGANTPLFLPRGIAPIRTLSWTILDRDPHGAN